MGLDAVGIFAWLGGLVSRSFAQRVTWMLLTSLPAERDNIWGFVTLETVYKVAICLKRNLAKKQIYFRNDLKLLLNGILGWWNTYFISDFAFQMVTL